MNKLALFATAVAFSAFSAVAFADSSREAVAGIAGVVVLRAHAVGAQVYACTSDGHGGLAWSFREPIATLMIDGRTVGRHFAGPSWELSDGSSITGQVVDKAPGDLADDIPWLKLSVVDHRGVGRLSDVTIVQRVATVGGNRTGPCEGEGSLLAVPYAADYVFSK